MDPRSRRGISTKGVKVKVEIEMSGKRPVLKAEKRKLLGRKVKRLRKQGILPASLYGKEVKSLPLQVDLKAVLKVWDQAGETGLVDLKIKGEKEARTVLLKNPQFDPLSDQLIHLDFHQVKLTEKVSVAIPIEVVGEAPAVDKGGILVTVLDEIEVEALPTDLPEKIVVDVSELKEIDQAITVADLPIDRKKIEVKVADDQVVVKAEPPTKEEEPAAEAPSETEAEEEKKSAEEKADQKEEASASAEAAEKNNNAS